MLKVTIVFIYYVNSRIFCVNSLLYICILPDVCVFEYKCGFYFSMNVIGGYRPIKFQPSLCEHIFLLMKMLISYIRTLVEMTFVSKQNYVICVAPS